MRRVNVIGASGSGKTTLGTALAAKLGVPFVELDALMHGPGWTPRPEFRADVLAAIASSGWVIDGNYADVRPDIWSRADTVIWLDPPRWLVMRQVIGRTMRRWALRRQLWNGNRESAKDWFSAEHPIRWAWVKVPEHRATYPPQFQQPYAAHLDVRTLRSRRECADLLAEL